MKGGTQPIILSLVVPWLCLAFLAALLSALASGNVVGAAEALKADYIKVSFSTKSATPDTYKSFIASVRDGLVSTAGGTSSGRIPVLIHEDDPLALETFLNITLVNKAARSVSLKMDVSGAYFAAYEAGNYSCLITRSSSGSRTSSSSVTCYQNVYPWGGIPTVTVVAPNVAAWRLADLDQAVSSLLLFPTGGATTEDLSRGLAALDVMVAVSAAYPYVERRMSAGMWDGNGVSNDGSVLVLQHSWHNLSAAIQESFQGAFAAPEYIQRSNGGWLMVDNVRRAMPLVSFLKNVTCGKKTMTTTRVQAAAVHQPRLPLLIRSVVDEEDMQMQLAGGGATKETAVAAACGQAEPTVRLAGANGRCVDVPNGSYQRGTQLILWDCNSPASVNQLWTLKRDGTIRSNGMCLAASHADNAGATVVVDDCPPRVPTARAVWEVRADGTVALKASWSGLVLAVTSSSNYAGLTVRRDDRGTGQSWTPTNDTAPLEAAIVGYRDRCLQVNNAGAVTIGACGNGVQWLIYPDGSIRPPKSLGLQGRCLAGDASGRVWVKNCEWAGSACERWVFRSDGTIFNTGAGMIMQVILPSSKGATGVTTTSSSGGQVVAVSPDNANGIGNPPNPNQKWVLML